MNNIRNEYKISLKVKKIIPESYFKTILANYNHYFTSAAMCFITTPIGEQKIFLNIYLNALISVETFIELCSILYKLNFIMMVSHQSIRLEFVKELDMNNHKLKPLLIQQIQSDKEPIIVEEPKECEICFNGLCNKVLTCKCCRKTICIDCCNNLPSREIRLMVNEDIVNDITKDFDTECEGIPQPTITYEQTILNH